MPTCNSQGKLGIFPEISHQMTEFLKRSRKCLYNLLLYIHQQWKAYFCRTTHTRLIVRTPLAALALLGGCDGDLGFDL